MTVTMLYAVLEVDVRARKSLHAHVHAHTYP